MAAIGRGIADIHTPAARAPWHRPGNRSTKEVYRVQVLVRDNNVDRALKVLKKKMQREGVFREMKLRGHYESRPNEGPGRNRRRFAAPASSLAKNCNARACCR